MEAEFGLLAPPVALHAGAPAVLAAVWMILRETLLAGDPALRAAKETIAAAVSLANACPYCVEVHGAALAGISPGGDAQRIMAGRFDEVADPRLRELARWAGGRALGGAVSGAAGSSTPALLAGDRAPAFLGVALTFHYINRMVSVFLGESPLDPIPDGARPVARRLAARMLGHFARAEVRPGRSLDLLPVAALPGDLAWAAGAPAIAGALARGCAAIGAAGSAVLPAAVRDLVGAGLDDPAATGPGISAGPWLISELSGLDPGDRPPARLALLTAWAPYRVTDADLAAVRAAGYGDDAVIAMTAWSSLAAARRIAGGLSAGLS
jgi:AhpD family alkylhydroperoxidase